MMLLRNHGLISRNINKIFGYNSRLDTIQACVANHMLSKIKKITNKRILNSKYLDKHLNKIDNIKVKFRQKNFFEVFHLYEFRVNKLSSRDKLVNFLKAKGIDAKIHYPIPMHLQPAARKYKYKKGDFPLTELISESTISLPVHEFIQRKHLDYMIKTIKEFHK